MAKLEIPVYVCGEDANATYVPVEDCTCAQLIEQLETVEKTVKINTANIATNSSQIQENTANIEENTLDIAVNTTHISENATAIEANTESIASNTEKIEANTESIDTLSNDVDEALSNIDAINSNIETLQDDASANTSNITTNASDIAALKTEVESNDTDIAALQTSVATNTSDISTLKTSVEGKQDKFVAGTYLSFKYDDDGELGLYADVSSGYYNKEEIESLLSQLQSISMEIVTELPSTGESNVIYLVQDTDESYDQYIYNNGEWVKIGTTGVDLSAYYTSTQVDSKITDLQTDITNNTTAITANADDISTLKTSVATNTTNIAKNTDDITKIVTKVKENISDIDTNTANIATNTASIETNASNIKTNTANIATNTSDIATLKTEVESNDTDIANLQKSVATNTTNIETNTASIATNTSDIATLKTEIENNASNIETNTNDISALEKDVIANTTNISANTTNIATNTSNISANTASIATNTANITTNASNISFLQNVAENNASNIKTLQDLFDESGYKYEVHNVLAFPENPYNNVTDSTTSQVIVPETDTLYFFNDGEEEGAFVYIHGYYRIDNWLKQYSFGTYEVTATESELMRATETELTTTDGEAVRGIQNKVYKLKCNGSEEYSYWVYKYANGYILQDVWKKLYDTTLFGYILNQIQDNTTAIENLSSTAGIRLAEYTVSALPTDSTITLSDGTTVTAEKGILYKLTSGTIVHYYLWDDSNSKWIKLDNEEITGWAFYDYSDCYIDGDTITDGSTTYTPTEQGIYAVQGQPSSSAGVTASVFVLGIYTYLDGEFKELDSTWLTLYNRLVTAEEEIATLQASVEEMITNVSIKTYTATSNSVSLSANGGGTAYVDITIPEGETLISFCINTSHDYTVLLGSFYVATSGNGGAAVARTGSLALVANVKNTTSSSKTFTATFYYTTIKVS